MLELAVVAGEDPDKDASLPNSISILLCVVGIPPSLFPSAALRSSKVDNRRRKPPILNIQTPSHRFINDHNTIILLIQSHNPMKSPKTKSSSDAESCSLKLSVAFEKS